MSNNEVSPSVGQPVVINTNSVYISNSIVVINTPMTLRTPPPTESANWLDRGLHIIKTSGVKITICVAGLLAIWAFLRFDVSQNLWPEPVSVPPPVSSLQQRTP